MTPENPHNLDDQDFTDDELLDQDDLGDIYDDESYDDENWEGAQAQPAPKPKKKFSVFNLVVFGIAGIVGIGILMSMLSGKSTSNNPELGAPSQDIVSAPQSQPTTEIGSLPSDTLPAPAGPQTGNNTDIANSQGFMNDSTLLDQSSGQEAPSLPEQGPSMTAPVSAETAVPEVTPAPQNLPNIDQIKKAEAPPTATPVVNAETQPASFESSSALESKLDQLISRIDSIEKKISDQPVSGGVNSDEIASLKSAVEKLESRVSKLAETPMPQRSESSVSYDDQPSKVVVKKSAPKRKITTPKPAASSSWELRGARPGEAMVGKSGQAELKTVRVGDNIAGIGQIQSISQTGGRWIIQGSTGSISQ
ncbi:MAG: hypothetical protein DI586_00630 [Micavibrio aeruginosavorus]|uniref:Uncharacterized protein n=1 Tax=Micavibrio aeruginosavorus TaxID=349221 RepID=A0A2W5FU66_9BACT|nr:MAG: hypothetical protein DI586_00630 [Micavibrio aeruginosavorus]